MKKGPLGPFFVFRRQRLQGLFGLGVTSLRCIENRLAAPGEFTLQLAIALVHPVADVGQMPVAQGFEAHAARPFLTGFTTRVLK